MSDTEHRTLNTTAGSWVASGAQRVAGPRLAEPRSRFPASLVLLALFLTGCAGYQLGPTQGGKARGESVYVELFGNETLQPGLEDDFTHAVRIGFQREGTYRLSRRGNADVLVEGVIRSYSREGLSYDPANPVQVRDYNLVAIARVTAIERRTGRTLLDQDVYGQTQIRSEADLTSAERQATPLLANNLARRIVDLVADGTW